MRVEGKVVATELDLIRDAGFATPHLLGPFDLEVEDGSLDIRFEAIRGSPKISGIEIIGCKPRPRTAEPLNR